MKYEWALFGALLLMLGIAACRSSFGEKISCGLIHQQAIDQGNYCYQYGDAYFCTKVTRKPVKRPTIRPAPEK